MYCEELLRERPAGGLPFAALRATATASPAAQAAASLNQKQYRARFGDYTLASVFQPIVSFSYRRVIGLEGLVRCSDDAGRSIAPSELMAQAESANTLLHVDRLARRLHVANYSAQGLAEGWLFLNMHPSVFLGMPASTENYFQTPLGAGDLPPSRVVIEILEDGVKDDLKLREGVAILREQGWGIALDDFGAGHSNFDRVWDVKPDIVKLDRSYALRAASDAAARRMLPAIVALLHEAGSLVLLEGIETAEQAMIAMDADIDLAQGYYFARPGAAHSVAGFAAGRVVDALWPEFEALRSAQRSHYRSAVDPYIAALGAAGQALAGGQTMDEACTAFLRLAQSDRCYLLDGDGFQVGPNVIGDARAVTPALAGYQQTSQARWSHRPYFQRAIAAPGKAQITRPYRSIATTCLCVTVSVSLVVHGRLHVLCGDLLWKDG